MPAEPEAEVCKPLPPVTRRALPAQALTLVAAALMDRAGRKVLMETSFGGMAACLSLMSALLMLPSEFTQEHTRGHAVVAPPLLPPLPLRPCLCCCHPYPFPCLCCCHPYP